jgi:catechol 2,3-dioxygenase-like lactoylglutathione lyase family enzyme
MNLPWARLVPELLVADLHESLRFWRDLCGFTVAFDRLDEGFAYLDRDGAQIMLEERGRNRNWVTALLEALLGRGVNFQSQRLGDRANFGSAQPDGVAAVYGARAEMVSDRRCRNGRAPISGAGPGRVSDPLFDSDR